MPPQAAPRRAAEVFLIRSRAPQIGHAGTTAAFSSTHCVFILHRRAGGDEAVGLTLERTESMRFGEAPVYQRGGGPAAADYEDGPLERKPRGTSPRAARRARQS